jgi:Zn-dependent M28 family amino/carboxypeptidase
MAWDRTRPDREPSCFECGPAEKMPDGMVTGDSGVLSVVFAYDDYDALDVGEGALALSVGIAGEAARGETAGALAASACANLA